MRRPTILFIALTLASACGRNPSSGYDHVDPETGTPLLPEYRELDDGVGTSTAAVLVDPQLEAADGCKDIARALRQQARESMIRSIQRQLMGAWDQRKYCDYQDSMPWGWGDSSVASADAGVSNSPPDDRPDSYTETNNQTAGADEADIVKTDGKHLYLVDGQLLRILRSWPAAETRELAKVEIEGRPQSLFVHEDRLLVYSELPRTITGSGCAYGSGYACSDPRSAVTQITIFDVTDRTAPQVIRKIRTSSSLLRARRFGSAVYTVLTSATRASFTLPLTPDTDTCDMSYDQIFRAYAQLLRDNLARIEQTAIGDDVFPSFEDTLYRSDEVAESPRSLSSCQRIYRTPLGDGNQLTSVLSVDMAADGPATAVSIFSNDGVVYASNDALYLAVARNAGRRWFSGWEQHESATMIHKFALDKTQVDARYEASGLAKGEVLNQFSLDEYQAHLRIATTTRTSQGSMGQHNTLTVLKQQGRGLVVTATVDDLAPTENIRSVRFDGDRGFVVTFKQTDPLFVFDLSDPTDPRMLAELKIPGFSTYMHMMDDDHILSIGYDGDEWGRVDRPALQIFDVTDLEDPVLIHKQVLGDAGSNSEALRNHLAFTYFAPKGLLALPLRICAPGDDHYQPQLSFDGLQIYDVSVAKGFRLRGQVPHATLDASSPVYCWSGEASAVKRSILMENFIYSISADLLKVNDLDALDTPVAEVTLD